LSIPRCPGRSRFDPREDIVAITVNRWPHGYGYFGEPDWTDNTRPSIVGRRPLGRIFIANSDAGARAFADAAMDEAHRAVSELWPAQPLPLRTPRVEPG
jgi:spermidine dehydrogenase